MVEIKRILVPTDFGECSQKALRYACDLGRTLGAELRILHVQKESVSYHGYDIECPDEIQQQLNACPAQSEAESPTVTRTFRVGPPAAEIIAEASDWNADLIVMGTQGHGPIKHLFVGSVAEKVVRGAECPVLTMHG